MSSMDKQNLIFPLSYDPDLKEKEEQEIYYRYLNAAFEEPRIKNIGVVGSYGVGKSSLLHSYEKREHKHFLYVTMGKSRDNNDDSKNAIERRILLQIYSKFRREDIPLSGFEMIREAMSHVKSKVAVGIIWLLVILLLTFYAPLGRLLKAKLPSNCLLIQLKTYIHIGLYITMIVLSLLIFGYLFDKLITKMHLRKISLKSENAELEVEREDDKDYLDQYSMELVYCLEQTAKKIGHTVVFEDMDRMKLKDVVDIFARLKEINTMVNQRLQKDNKYIKFVYVVNDAVLAKMEHYKFFDYVLPVVPGVNPRTSNYIFRKNLARVNNYLKSRLQNETLNEEFRELESTKPDTMVNCAAPFLSDYRLQYMILNDYSIFMEMNAVHNEIEKGQKTAQKLLALAIYKNVWPGYYESLSSGRQTRFFALELENIKCSELASMLTRGDDPYLTYDSLYYLGYSTKEIVQDLVWKIRNTEQTEEQIKLVREMPNNEFAFKGLEEILSTDGQDENDADKKNLYKTILRAFIVKKYKNAENLFENRDLKLCIEIMSELMGGGVLQYMREIREEEWAADKNGGYDVFRHCKNRNMLTQIDDLTETQFKVLIRGLSYTDEFKDVYMSIIGSDKSRKVVDLGESILKNEIMEV
ncbi:MAG: hypothetical protein PUC51_02405 [Ruminococcus sp.]|nr:hypothetical protein [Ruminococcus sp.]